MKDTTHAVGLLGKEFNEPYLILDEMPEILAWKGMGELLLEDLLESSQEIQIKQSHNLIGRYLIGIMTRRVW